MWSVNMSLQDGCFFIYSHDLSFQGDIPVFGTLEILVRSVVQFAILKDPGADGRGGVVVTDQLDSPDPPFLSKATPVRMPAAALWS